MYRYIIWLIHLEAFPSYIDKCNSLILSLYERTDRLLSVGGKDLESNWNWIRF